MTTSLINKIELLIKREKTTPERKKDEPSKSSSEILSELFGAFNADPPKIEEISTKKSKKSKKKHKKEKKKRSRSSSSSSVDSEYSHRRKKRKKSKSKRQRSQTPSSTPTRLPPSTPKRRSRSPKIKSEPEPVQVKNEPPIKTEDIIIKMENVKEIKTEPTEPETPPPPPHRRVSIVKIEETEVSDSVPNMDACLIPMPEPPIDIKLEPGDLRERLDSKRSESESEKCKGKIQIKNLKFSTVFEETVKKAEEEARKRAEKYEEGEYTDSSSESIKEVAVNSQFPKTSDPGGLKKAAEECKVSKEEKIARKKTKKVETTHKSSKHESSKSKRSSSRSRRSKSRSASTKHSHHSSSKSHRSRSRHRSSSRSRRRSKSRSKMYPRHHSPRYRGGRRSRSPTGVKLADSEKKRLLEVARRNAINMLKNGAVPAGAAALPPHTRNQVMAAIQSGGKSVDELTDFCKHLSKKEALGELSSVSSRDDDMSENEDTLAFHHPFLVKEKAPIIMNIRGGAPLPIKSSALPVANKEELRLQFPVSSGSQHREKACEWTPVSPKKDMQVAKLNSKHSSTSPVRKAIESSSSTVSSTKSGPLALPAPPPVPLPPPAGPPHTPAYLKAIATAAQITSISNALPAPGPQAYPPGVEGSNIDLAKIVSQKLLMIRKEQEQNELTATRGVSHFGWTKESASLGQFTGSTGAQILTPRELASGTQAWAKKDQLTRAAPVEGGMGMHLLQKMGWTPGRGLGKEGTGTLQPLLLEVKLDTKGLQAKEEVSSRGNRGMKPQRCRGLGRSGSGGGGGAAASGGVTLVAGGKHPVSLLGEYCSKQKVGPPEYNLCFECGPDHKKNFLFKVKVAGIEYQPAVASQNKKQAKADAAQLALQKIGILT